MVQHQALQYLMKELEKLSCRVWEVYPLEGNYRCLRSCDQFGPPAFLPMEDTPYEILHSRDGDYLSFAYDKNFYVICHLPTDSPSLEKEEMEQWHCMFYLLYAQSIIHAKDTQLMNTIHGIRSITSSLDLEEVLTNIISNALSVIRGANAGFLLLYEPETKYLISKASVGFSDDILHFRLKVGESICGKVLLLKHNVHQLTA